MFGICLTIELPSHKTSVHKLYWQSLNYFFAAAAPK
jgi:hypothetical protein